MGATATAARSDLSGGLERRQILRALRAFRRGDFSTRLPMDLVGVDGEIAEAFNDVVSLNEDFTRELKRLRVDVGRDGKIDQRGQLDGAAGRWRESVDLVNGLITDTV